MTNPRPCSPAEAVARALQWAGAPIIYRLGAGDYQPNGPDVPWTGADKASDCRFACCYAYKLTGSRPGYNHGAWATVSDDLNYNSACEDADHAQELFVNVTDAPRVGDIICYPTIRLSGHIFIGHGCIVVGVDRSAAFDVSAPNFSLLDVVHCHGPDGRGPAITKSDGAIWDLHSTVWPKQEHKSRLLRPVG